MFTTESPDTNLLSTEAMVSDKRGFIVQDFYWESPLKNQHLIPLMKFKTVDFSDRLSKTN